MMTRPERGRDDHEIEPRFLMSESGMARNPPLGRTSYARRLVPADRFKPALQDGPLLHLDEDQPFSPPDDEVDLA